jgi:uncharacterized protein (TIGR00297 family)
MAERALIAALFAALITALARRFELLDASGQWGAFACGIAAAVAGWPWAILLVLYFIAASAVTALGAPRKAERTQRSLPQSHARTAMQVLANGAVFSLLAVMGGARAESAWAIGAFGALAAASADTWATEIGTLWGGTPRSVLNFRPVTTGMSGGVTGVGSLAAVVGALLVAAAAVALHDIADTQRVFFAAAGGGIAGAFADSILGASAQARRWCDHCKEWTERRVHPCSYRTVHAAGARWITNDTVNFAATVVGAGTAAALGSVLR